MQSEPVRVWASLLMTGGTHQVQYVQTCFKAMKRCNANSRNSQFYAKPMDRVGTLICISFHSSGSSSMCRYNSKRIAYELYNYIIDSYSYNGDQFDPVIMKIFGGDANSKCFLFRNYFCLVSHSSSPGSNNITLSDYYLFLSIMSFASEQTELTKQHFNVSFLGLGIPRFHDPVKFSVLSTW